MWTSSFCSFYLADIFWFTLDFCMSECPGGGIYMDVVSYPNQYPGGSRATTKNDACPIGIN